MSEPGYYRYPTIAQGQVVFVSEDDLWTVPQTGGAARRLTSGWGTASRPILSPDGQHIAFVGREEGDSEVYVMDAQGGPLTRLTYLAAGTQPVAFDPDGSLIISSNAGQPFRSLFMLYRVPLSGGEPIAMNLGPANNIAYGPGGLMALGRNTTDPARWKRYRGGTRGQLWLGHRGSDAFTRYEGANGNFAAPVWVGTRLYFISDHEGYANIYSVTAEGRDLTRHTDHETYYVRNAASDGHVIVYHAGGDLYLLNPEDGSDTRIPIQYFSQRTQSEIHYAPAADYWTEYQLSENGASVLITTRGKLFHMGTWEGPATALGITEGVRYRQSTPVPGGSQILTISDDGGEEGLALIDSATNALQSLPGAFGEPNGLKVSPDGQFAALSNNRGELWVADLKALTLLRVDGSSYGPIHGMNFAPDSRWIAYSMQNGAKTSAIKVYNLKTQAIHTLTHPVLMDAEPVWDPKGRYLYFLSYRVFDPVYDNLRFDLSFPNGMHPYVIVLQDQKRSPFQPAPRPLVEKSSPAAGAEDAPEAAALVSIDMPGILDRCLPFPVREGLYRQLACDADHVYWTTVEPHGSINNSFYAEAGGHATLSHFSLKDLKEEVLATHIASFALSADRTAMALRQGKRLRVIKTGDKADDKTAPTPGRDTGYVDLHRISLAVNRPAEWNQMLREAWRLMRDNFWSPTMSGHDWDEIFRRYQRLLPRIATRSDFSDLIWEMQGELGTSHAYELGGDYRAEPKNRVGFLAADWTWDAAHNGFRITRIVHGDSSQAGETSPLLAPGTGVSEGDILVMIDNKPVAPDLPPPSHLINKAGQEVRIRFLKSGTFEPVETVVVPLAQEMPARYRAWVKTNAQKVHEATHGRIGYVHIPDMGPKGFAEFYKAYLAESERDGLIVDVRFNGGGHVSQLILENLQRKRLGYDVPRHGQPEPYPGDSILGPIVALTNEYAGSDGDIFSHSFKLMNLGPLVGERTWGGVIGISVRHRLVDGSVTTQPEFSFWFNDVGWGVENYGTDPTIPVANTPHDYAQRHDAQLHRAIEEALTRLEEHPPHVPDFSDRPHIAPDHLPPRHKARE